MDRIKGLDLDTRKELANSYKNIVDRLEIFDKPKNIYELSTEFGKLGTEMNARKWRSICEDIMYLYIYGNLDFVITGNSNGYTATNDIDHLKAYLTKKHNQAIALMSNYSKLKKCLETRFNESFDFGEAYEESI